MKRMLSAVLVAVLCICATACEKKSNTELNTLNGDVNASELVNWGKYEEAVVKKIKLGEEEKAEIDEKVDAIKGGTATESEIDAIIKEHGSVSKYKEYLELQSKYAKAREESTKYVKDITEEDRKAFIDNYSDTFGGRNAIVLQFNDADLCNNFYSELNTKSLDEVISYISKLADNSKCTWDTMNEFVDKTGIKNLHNADSNKYNYCLGDKLIEKFDSLVDGQMSEPFLYNEVNTIMIRVSNNAIEKDDSLIDNYLLKMKREEAYKIYIIENK